MPKKPKRKRRRTKKYEQYSGGKPKKTPCPKCGASIFLAEHKDRSYCGRCGYTVWKKESK